MRVRRALFLSDIHFGWVPLVKSHERLLDALPAAAEDAELVVLNGDIIDHHRGLPSSRVRALVDRFAALVASWRNEGREVVYIEGNHDPMTRATGPIVPDRWHYDFEGHDGRRVRALHGHRLTDDNHAEGSYERFGKYFLRFENWSYARLRPLAWAYPASIGWLVGAVGHTEDRLWRPAFEQALETAAPNIDVLVHGHFHFGPGQRRVGRIDLFKSGAWVSPGHRGSVDRILRYVDGRFERITLDGDRWVVPGDGR